MPKKSKELTAKGNKQEVQAFHDVNQHYVMAKADLDNRRKDFDKKDELFRSYIDESKWPYQSLVFDPRVYTGILEKTSRLFAQKPRGKLVPREGGDTLGAQVANELLGFQWDDNQRVDNSPMLAKWSLMDQNARKYGASFGLVKWHYETNVKKKNDKGEREVWYDGPNFVPWNNRDVLADPSYSTIKNWIQLREYVTIDQLQSVNDAAKTKPVYKNLDILKDSVKDMGGDMRSANYYPKNLSIKQLTDTLGEDQVFKTVEIVTEYRRDRWITFAPKHGVVLRDIDNPYDHGQIPVVMLKYYPVDDDIYGLSEIEPIEKLQRGINSLVCQYIDAINMGLYPIVKVRSTGVQMHTLEWGPGKKWIMDDPTDVVAHEQGLAGVSEFTSTYRFLVGALQEGLGESSAGVSNLVPGQADKTATEVRDLALQRNARDNFNQIFLAEALKKQMLFWHMMNAQFFFNEDQMQKVVRIVGKEAARFFESKGLNTSSLTDEAANLLSEEIFDGMGIQPSDLETLSFPVDTKEGTLPKFIREPGEDVGFLIIEKSDLSGQYDYIADVESMTLPRDSEKLAALTKAVEIALNPAVEQQLQAEGYSIKKKDVIEDYFEVLGMRDASKYFERAQGGQNVPEQTGNVGNGGGPQGSGVGKEPGLGGGPEALLGEQTEALLG
jgi:hypothetical protein